MWSKRVLKLEMRAGLIRGCSLADADRVDTMSEAELRVILTRRSTDRFCKNKRREK
jgi:hypothetical protein